jgi:hypothetical protein
MVNIETERGLEGIGVASYSLLQTSADMFQALWTSARSIGDSEASFNMGDGKASFNIGDSFKTGDSKAMPPKQHGATAEVAWWWYGAGNILVVQAQVGTLRM